MKRLLLLIATLLLTLPALAEPEERAAAFAAEHLPGYTFMDGVQFEETAMILVEDEAGLVYFAGCAWDGEEWTITMSTPFPEWMDVGLDTFHAGEGSIDAGLYLPEEYCAYEDSGWLDVYIELLKDGTWRIWGVNTGWEVISFNRHSISLDVGFEFYGDLTIPLNITQVDWVMLPRSFEEAMALMDTSGWRLINVNNAHIYVQPDEQSAIVTLGSKNAAVQYVSEQDGMIEVRFFGQVYTGWMLEEDLIPASEQVKLFAAWDEDPDNYYYRDIVLDNHDPAVNWYEIAHDDSTSMPFYVEHVEYLYHQGWCPEKCCCLLYSQTLNECGYVPVEQLSRSVE